MKKWFSYTQATQDQLNKHIGTLSCQAIHQSVLRYTEANDYEMVRKIKLAVVMNKLSKLQKKAAELSKGEK